MFKKYEHIEVNKNKKRYAQKVSIVQLIMALFRNTFSLLFHITQIFLSWCDFSHIVFTNQVSYSFIVLFCSLLTSLHLTTI
jgi:hypothetical protein